MHGEKWDARISEWEEITVFRDILRVFVFVQASGILMMKANYKSGVTFGKV